jgi:predicted TIM-barrel fold metal-dependent hydrolase
MYSGGVIDCDVHHDWPTQDALYPYFSTGWREYLEGPTRVGFPPIPLNPGGLFPNPGGSANRADARPPNGAAPGSDYDLMRRQLLDPSRIERAVLSFNQGLYISNHPNPYFAAELARAANDWSIDTWLDGKDDRLYGAVVVATQQPDVAAREIRRVGAHPRIAEVLVCGAGLGKPFGYPIYDPIYDAAVEMDLPVAIHVGNEFSQGVSSMASGMPSLYFEQHVSIYQSSMSHILSMIIHGVFEKHPRLRVMLVESTLAWIPWLLWTLDYSYKAARRETPWLKRLPSDYFRDHVRLTTQPLDPSPEPEQLIEILKMIGGEELLCFSSDYPHWDGDEVDYVSKRLPTEWLPKIFRENAMEWYRWS